MFFCYFNLYLGSWICVVDLFLKIAGYKKYPSMPDRCYKLHTTARSWNDAFQVCAAEKAHLIILNSAEEAKLCTDIFMEYTKSTPLGNFNRGHVMVGFNDLIITGEHRTVDGKNNFLIFIWSTHIYLIAHCLKEFPI